MASPVNTAIFAAPRPDWLAQIDEPILDPARRIVDAHHHLWDPLPSRYPGTEYLSDIRSGHNVVASVYVECKSAYRQDGPEWLRPLGEIEFAVAAAGESVAGSGAHVCAGIVGFADLRLLRGKAAEVLPLFSAAGGGRLKGIRNVSAWTAEAAVSPPLPDRFEGHLCDAAFREGFACLAPHGLVFDAFLYHPQLADLIDLARAFPETTIVLDHVGGPLGRGSFASRRTEVFEEWRHSIEQLARCGNVYVKLGGLGMKLAGFDLHDRAKPPTSDEVAAAWRPFVETTIQCFGPNRCMFESNFPPDKGSVSYPVLWNAFKKLAAGYSEDEKERLFSGTAVETYDLALPSD